MPTNITEKEANILRGRAIAKAKDLTIAELVLYMLESEAAIKEGMSRTRALPGSGYLLQGRVQGDHVHSLRVVSADNPTEFVFRYEKNHSNEKYTVFRDGPWVMTLIGAVETLKYELENKDVIKILNDFGPVGGD